jgi:hypothetical protein
LASSISLRMQPGRPVHNLFMEELNSRRRDEYLSANPCFQIGPFWTLWTFLNDVDAGAYGFREFIELAFYALAGPRPQYIKLAERIAG